MRLFVIDCFLLALTIYHCLWKAPRLQYSTTFYYEPVTYNLLNSHHSRYKCYITNRLTINFENTRRIKNIWIQNLTGNSLEKS